MKALAGGNLIPELKEAFQWIRSIPAIGSVAVGVISEAELLMDLSYFGMIDVDPDDISIEYRKKRLHILSRICIGCGNCVEQCPNSALRLEDKVARVDHEKCLLCGYCGPVCSEFAIRVV